MLHSEMADDEKFMAIALEEARKGVGHTSPNPAVGAVITHEGNVLATGFHRAAGGAHAEIEALNALEDIALARGATMYVTLEPCSTHGRTPPCADALIEAGFERVVIGTTDPNPDHAGRAVPLLEKAGIEVTCGVLEPECRNLNVAFNKWMLQKLPWVIAKAGMTLDGKISRASGLGQWITNEASRCHAQKLRARVDAILVGAGTVRKDRPKLTVRGIANARQPWRVVLTRSGNLPHDVPLFQDEHSGKTLIESGETLLDVMRALGGRGIQSVLIEGGANVLGQAFDECLVDEVAFYVAPLLGGGMPTGIGGRGSAMLENATRLEEVVVENIDGDIFAGAKVCR